MATSAPVRLQRLAPALRAGRWLRRMAFLVHRWLGIALALLMAMWTLSGIVMMYVSFPETTEAERLSGLAPIELAGCCDSIVMPPDAEISDAAVEMLAGEPVLHWRGPSGASLINLSPAALPQIDRAKAGTIAATHLELATGAQRPVTVEQITRDQWTVYGRFRAHAPLFKASFADHAGTVLYVSGTTGEVVQDTARTERFWNWLGAVPHWLYFTAFRELQPLWYNFVVYASVLGIFLTVTGIYVGIHMHGKGKRRSPYRGIALWHHWTGLAFGVLTLTWVFSGLVSMQPWGWFESAGPGRQVAALAGRPMEPADVAALYSALATNTPKGVVSAELAIQGGAPVAILQGSDGTRRRATLPDLSPARLSPEQLRTRAQSAMPDVPLASATLITAPDAYHYPHHTDVVLPAYRAIFANAEQTRLYFDPATGEMINHVDDATRGFRWLHLGLHRLDFTTLTRSRPLWDALMLPLLAGVALLCCLGVWMGVRRLLRKSQSTASRGRRWNRNRRCRAPSHPVR